MQRFRVLYAQGNLNNQIGVPLTLLRLTADDELAVVEMGANHPGDIRELVNIVEPDYGIITNVGKAHLQGFGSFEGVIRTKGELYDFLRTRPQSVIFLRNDNPYLARIADGLKAVRYGRPQTDGQQPAVCGEVVECSPFLHFRWQSGGEEWHHVATHLIGAYNVDNLLAAVTIGRYFGVPSDRIDAALEAYVPSNNRSQLEQTAHNHLIIDAYNANPTSMAAALDNFRQMTVSPKMVILGAMKELGEYSAREHRAVAEAVSADGFDRVWLVGEEFADAVPSKARFFRTADEVIEALKQEPLSGYYVLIKGSNSMKLASVVPYL